MSGKHSVINQVMVTLHQMPKQKKNHLSCAITKESICLYGGLYFRVDLQKLSSGQTVGLVSNYGWPWSEI